MLLHSVLLDETENHLELKKVSIDDDGAYKCIGKNSWGRESIEFHVSILQQAKIIKADEEQKVLRNEISMRLSCTVRGNPLPIVTWISNGHIFSTTSRLNLEKLFTTVGDSTIFFNGYGNGISYLDPFKLKQLNEKFYSQLTKIDEKTLKLDMVFKNLDIQAAGNYQCYAYNALGRDEKVVEVKVHQKPYINEKQTIQISEIEVLESLPLLLVCLISGEPKPTVTWYKNTNQLYENTTLKLLNDNRFLSVAETFSWDSGNYLCKGKNEVGKASIEFKVSVLAPPKFIEFAVTSPLTEKRFHNDKIKFNQKKGNNEIKVMRGDDVPLECLAKGSPRPKVHWIKMNFYDSSKNEILDDDEDVMVSFVRVLVC